MNRLLHTVVVCLLAVPFTAALTPSSHALAQSGKDRTAREKSKVRDAKDGAKPSEAERKPKQKAERADTPKPVEPATKSKPRDGAVRDAPKASEAAPVAPVRDKATAPPRPERDGAPKPARTDARDAGPKKDTQRTEPKIVPGANRGIPKSVVALANRMGADVKQHRVRIAQLDRLIAHFEKAGHAEQLARTRAVKKKELALHAGRLDTYRAELGDDMFARAHQKLDPKRARSPR